MTKKLIFPPPNGMSAEWYRAQAICSTINAAAVQARLLGWPEVYEGLDKLFQAAFDLMTEISRRDSEAHKRDLRKVP